MNAETAGTGKGWPSRNDLLLVVIRIRVWIPEHFLAER